MTFDADRFQVFRPVCATMGSELSVMNLQALESPTPRTQPRVSLKDPFPMAVIDPGDQAIKVSYVPTTGAKAEEASGTISVGGAASRWSSFLIWWIACVASCRSVIGSVICCSM